MKKNYKSILFTGSFIIGALLNSQVLAQQKSTYTPFVHTGYSDYKIHYDPQGTRVINSDGETTLTTGHANFSFEKIKIFVPPGTKRFYAKFQTYLSPTEAKAAARFAEVPVANADGVNQNTRFSDFEKTLDRLLLGDELLFHAPGGSGGFTVSQPSSTDNSNAVKGGYIYLNLLSIPAGSILSVQTRIVVDETCYRRWYTSAKWDFQNNPDENANHTCDGSSGGGGTTPVTPTEPTLTSIKLSTETWKAGTATANQPITVTASDANGTMVALPSCTAAVTNGSLLNTSLVLKITPDSNGKQAQITIEKPELITKAEEVSITCGGKTAALKLWPAEVAPPQVATITSSVVENSTQGASTLTIKLTHPETATDGTIDYFVAAHIPQFQHPDNPFGSANDQWVFLSLPETGTGAANWKVLFSATSLDKLAFKKGVALPTGNEVELPINLQLSIDALKIYNAKLYLGYRQGATGTFKALVSPIWQASANP